MRAGLVTREGGLALRSLALALLGGDAAPLDSSLAPAVPKIPEGSPTLTSGLLPVPGGCRRRRVTMATRGRQHKPPDGYMKGHRPGIARASRDGMTVLRPSPDTHEKCTRRGMVMGRRVLRFREVPRR